MARIVEDLIETRLNGNIELNDAKRVDLIDISPLMISGSAAALDSILGA